MKKVFLTILLFCSVSLGQSLLKNQDVIDMVKIGLDEKIIVAKIQTSETNFDTATPALKNLSESGVPSSVIVAMMESANKNKKADDSINKIPEQGSLSDLKGLKRVFVVSNDLSARDIIIEEIKKQKFEVVDKIENSDFAVRYFVEEQLVYSNGLTKLVGELKVIMPSKESDRLRNIYSVRKEKYYIWTDNPAKMTIRQFLKDMEKAHK